MVNTTIGYVRCLICGFEFYRDQPWHSCPLCIARAFEGDMRKKGKL